MEIFGVLSHPRLDFSSLEKMKVYGPYLKMPLRKLRAVGISQRLFKPTVYPCNSP